MGRTDFIREFINKAIMFAIEKLRSEGLVDNVKVDVRVSEIECDHVFVMDKDGNVVCMCCQEKWVKEKEDCLKDLKKPKKRWDD